MYFLWNFNDSGPQAAPPPACGAVGLKNHCFSYRISILFNVSSSLPGPSERASPQNHWFSYAFSILLNISYVHGLSPLGRSSLKNHWFSIGFTIMFAKLVVFSMENQWLLTIPRGEGGACSGQRRYIYVKAECYAVRGDSCASTTIVRKEKYT